MEIDEKGGEEAKFTVKLSIVHTLLCIKYKTEWSDVGARNVLACRVSVAELLLGLQTLTTHVGG